MAARHAILEIATDEFDAWKSHWTDTDVVSPTRNSRHQIRMSYGFHSSERINRRRTKISIHDRSRSHYVTVVPFLRFLLGPRAFGSSLNRLPPGYLRPCNELSTLGMIFLTARYVLRVDALARSGPGLSRILTRLHPGLIAHRCLVFGLDILQFLFALSGFAVWLAVWFIGNLRDVCIFRLFIL